MDLCWKVQPDDIRYLIIYLDGTPWKRVYKAFFSKALGALNECKSQQGLQEAFSAIEEKAAKLAALRALARRSLSEHELTRKLAKKELSALAIQKALTACRKLGVLDDSSYLRLFAEREERKGYGPKYIALKLKHKAPASPEIVNSIISEVAARQTKILEKVIAKKFAKMNWKDPKQKHKAFVALQRRGFAIEKILVLCHA
ncbi:MAG TPA: regulatory protein RecX [Rhabdochlamydiaceae bacterium]|nr:regulatory protein RecX [Rhabdochlamydiaceae bacterium]